MLRGALRLSPPGSASAFLLMLTILGWFFFHFFLGFLLQWFWARVAVLKNFLVWGRRGVVGLCDHAQLRNILQQIQLPLVFKRNTRLNSLKQSWKGISLGDRANKGLITKCEVCSEGRISFSLVISSATKSSLTPCWRWISGCSNHFGAVWFGRLVPLSPFRHVATSSSRFFSPGFCPWTLANLACHCRGLIHCQGHTRQPRTEAIVLALNRLCSLSQSLLLLQKKLLDRLQVTEKLWRHGVSPTHGLPWFETSESVKVNFPSIKAICMSARKHTQRLFEESFQQTKACKHPRLTQT